MAVIVRYVVERNGVEKMTFTSKKEADAYDKLLDIAEALETVLAAGPVEMDADEVEALSLYLANQKDQLQAVLKGQKAALATDTSGQAERSPTTAKPTTKKATAQTAKKTAEKTAA